MFQLVSSFQLEATAKSHEAEQAKAKLASVRKMIAKLLKSINEVSLLTFFLTSNVVVSLFFLFICYCFFITKHFFFFFFFFGGGGGGGGRGGEREREHTVWNR